MVLGAAEIDALLKDDRLCSTKTAAIRAKGITDCPSREFYKLSMQVWDDPEHRKRAPTTSEAMSAMGHKRKNSE